MTKRIKSVSIDQVMKALGDPVRISVVKQLLDAGEEMACGTFEHSLTKATFSHHIKILLDAGVISRREDGTRKFLSLNEALDKEYPGLLKLIQQS
ncbi:ArsR/SmtB family transcription factor [Peredibacter starrii]|uniref:Helix-turn-helix domain-containing protein n=1 Tax=Peredibacter starrii TaxID=28202 RepID=A0AAX4HU68_9BACT|nr:helix-turn-helix domain-containing protein [Peredibacter starrii]WPU66732.1 helix-turn-helix domain-containing protein [Peredibacter starrii]